MATLVGTQSDLNELLEKLVELDFDAIEAYDAAIERLEDTTSITAMREFRADHQRHTQELGRVLEESGRRAPRRGDIKAILTKGKVVIASLVGDRAILLAMKTNEDDTNTAYERAVSNRDAPPFIREILQRNLADERRHRAWIQERLSALASK